jgi:hypothetical protein
MPTYLQKISMDEEFSSIEARLNAAYAIYFLGFSLPPPGSFTVLPPSHLLAGAEEL